MNVYFGPFEFQADIMFAEQFWINKLKSQSVCFCLLYFRAEFRKKSRCCLQNVWQSMRSVKNHLNCFISLERLLNEMTTRSIHISSWQSQLAFLCCPCSAFILIYLWIRSYPAEKKTVRFICFVLFFSITCFSLQISMVFLEMFK